MDVNLNRRSLLLGSMSLACLPAIPTWPPELSPEPEVPAEVQARLLTQLLVLASQRGPDDPYCEIMLSPGVYDIGDEAGIGLGVGVWLPDRVLLQSGPGISNTRGRVHVMRTTAEQVTLRIRGYHGRQVVCHLIGPDPLNPTVVLGWEGIPGVQIREPHRTGSSYNARAAV